jgi:hypothetical protein
MAWVVSNTNVNLAVLAAITIDLPTPVTAGAICNNGVGIALEGDNVFLAGVSPPFLANGV